MTQQTTTRPAATTHATATRGSKANKTLWTLQAIAAVVFVMAASSKLFGEAKTVESFNDMGYGDVGRYIIGTLELVGVVALLTPRLSGPAGLAFTGLMIGAIISTLLTLSASQVVFPVFVLILVAVIAWGRRDTTARLLDAVRGR